MVKAFIVWITLQLVLIGCVEVRVHNQVIRGEYECVKVEVPEWLGMVLPLATIIPTPQFIEDYCQNK